ncbi:MAG: YggU family protein [Candidatus Brocadia sp. WS118]|nr:MAG: YggU family protein [Candidatus Brocadia sp. WS118]
MLDLVTTNSGVILSIRTQPGSSKNRIIGEYGGRLKLAVTAAPEKGKANKAVIELLADTFRIHESSIHIISGESSRDKRVLIEGLILKDLKSLLSQQV